MLGSMQASKYEVAAHWATGGEALAVHKEESYFERVKIFIKRKLFLRKGGSHDKKSLNYCIKCWLPQGMIVFLPSTSSRSPVEQHY